MNFRLGIVWLYLLLLTDATALARAENARAEGALHLVDGDFLAGRLAECEEAGVVRWQMKGAIAPFDFPASALRVAYFPPPDSVPVPMGDYLFELADGDTLFGSLVSVTPELFEFKTARLGLVRVERTEVRRILRWNGSSPNEYHGPNSLAEWRHNDEHQWNEEAGRLATKTAGAQLQKQLSIPKKARVELEIAGDSDLQFTLILSSDTSDEQLQQGFRFEVWQRSLVVLRELEDRAEIRVVCELNAKENHVQLELLLDQVEGTISVHAFDGKQLASISMPPQGGEESHPLGWITLQNGRGELRLERLAVGHWSGQLPVQFEADKAGLFRSDGTVVYGDAVGYDADLSEFLVRTEEAEVARVAAADVSCIFPAPTVQPGDYPFRISLHDGNRVSGELSKIAGDKVYVARRGLKEPLVCAVSDIRSIVGLRPSNNPPKPPPPTALLELAGVRSHGSLVAATATAERTCLVWQPRQSSTSSPLDHNIAGRIVYRERPNSERNADRRAARQRELRRRAQLRELQQRQRLQNAGVFQRALRALTTTAQNPAAEPKPSGGGTLHFLAGDRIPCEVTEIKDDGVHFKSSVVDATFAPHQSIKAIELVASRTDDYLAEQKRQRLLTLPRMQKSNPPTHLVISTGGDILRTRLISLSADALVVEARLETKTIARDRVASLIWLNDERSPAAPGSPEPVATSEDASNSPRVQAVRDDGVRLTFVPSECTGTELLGASKLLGACRLDLGKVDSLVLGQMIETVADDLKYHEWKLSDAVEPRFSSDAAQKAGGNPSSIAELELISKRVAAIELELLDGGTFKLSEQRGNVLVLDFWASWCGPCMQLLPQVDAVVAEFAERDVKLVTVNMQEDREAVTRALERLNIKPSVALDIDGVALELFQVTAIPHTVVIDKDGNVVKLFMGANADSAKELRTAIEELVAPPTAQ